MRHLIIVVSKATSHLVLNGSVFAKSSSYPMEFFTSFDKVVVFEDLSMSI